MTTSKYSSASIGLPVLIEPTTIQFSDLWVSTLSSMLQPLHAVLMRSQHQNTAAHQLAFLCSFKPVSLQAAAQQGNLFLTFTHKYKCTPCSQRDLIVESSLLNKERFKKKEEE